MEGGGGGGGGGVKPEHQNACSNVPPLKPRALTSSRGSRSRTGLQENLLGQRLQPRLHLNIRANLPHE